MRSSAAALTLFLMILFPCMLFSQGTVLYPGITSQALLSKLVQDYRPAAVQSYSNARDILFGEIYNDSNIVSYVDTGYMAYLNPATTIPIEIAKKCKVIFEVFDISGKRIDAVNLGKRSPGECHFQWTYQHTPNNQTQSGPYVYHLSAGSNGMTDRMRHIK